MALFVREARRIILGADDDVAYAVAAHHLPRVHGPIGEGTPFRQGHVAAY
jgi:hypothetical protein